MKVAIVGSRDWPSREAVTRYVLALPNDTVVISGGAPGVDRIAEKTARVIGLKVEVYPADWFKHGKRAGALRNQQIVDAADRIVAFWDGISKGTKITIDMAKRAGKPLEVITPMTPPPNNDEERA